MTGGGSSQSSSSAPWEAQAPYLKQLFSSAQDLFNQGPYKSPDFGTTVGPSRETGQAFGMTSQRALGGDPTVRAGRQYTESVLRGDRQDPNLNPALQRYADIGARNLTDQYYGARSALGSRMEGAGRSGGGTERRGVGQADEALATGLGDLQAKIYGPAYAQGEQNRMAAAASAPGTYGQEQYRSAAALRGVGADRENFQRDKISDMMRRFEQSQRGGSEKLAEFAQFLGGPIMEGRSEGSSFNFGLGPFGGGD